MDLQLENKLCLRKYILKPVIFGVTTDCFLSLIIVDTLLEMHFRSFIEGNQKFIKVLERCYANYANLMARQNFKS